MSLTGKSLRVAPCVRVGMAWVATESEMRWFCEACFLFPFPIARSSFFLVQWTQVRSSRVGSARFKWVGVGSSHVS